MNRLPPILIVDDEKNMRASLKSILSDEGYSVVAVESAEEGLNQLRCEEFFMLIPPMRASAG